MIQNPSKDLTLIVYNTPSPPRYLKLNKKLIRFFVLIVPTLVILFISMSFMYSMYLKNKVNDLKAKEPKIIADLNGRNSQLLNKISMLQKNNNLLTKKLSMGASVDSPVSLFGLITPPVGLVDKRGMESIDFTDFKVTSSSKEIRLTFNLDNKTPDNQKLSGHIIVTQYQGQSVQYYPAADLGQKNLRLEYTQGESFGFSRLRPTKVSFKKLGSESVQYKIFIFSRTGDLISLKQIGPFNIE